MNTEIFYSSTFIATIVLALLGYGLYSLKKKNSDKNLGELINHLFLREKITFNVLGMIFINVAEAFMAASISPPGEIAINPIARFTGHLVVALVGISMALSSMAAISRVKVAKEGKTGLVVKAAFTLIMALFVPYLNALLIASGLGEVNNFAYFTHGDITGSMTHSSYAMNATLIMTLMHYIFFATDATSVLSSKDTAYAASILNSFGTPAKGQGSEVDKNINKRGDEEKKKDVKGLIKELLQDYRIQKPEDRDRYIQRSLDAIDRMSSENRATLTFAVADLAEKVKKLKAEKANKTDSERSEINSKIYSAIHNLWEGSTSNGKGFGFELPKKQGLGN